MLLRETERVRGGEKKDKFVKADPHDQSSCP